jgi:hypothetical protein
MVKGGHDNTRFIFQLAQYYKTSYRIKPAGLIIMILFILNQIIITIQPDCHASYLIRKR